MFTRNHVVHPNETNKMSNPHRNNPRGKNSAMLRRLRSRDADEDDNNNNQDRGNPPPPAANQAAARTNADEEDAAAPPEEGAGDPLPRLIARLRREHAANFAGSGRGAMAACGNQQRAASNFTLRYVSGGMRSWCRINA